MNYIDIIIVLVVLLFLGLVIYFSFIRPHVGKHKKVGNCGCGTCPMGQDKKAKRFLKEYHKQNKKDEQ
jgi:hypothetical protein